MAEDLDYQEQVEKWDFDSRVFDTNQPYTNGGSGGDSKLGRGGLGSAYSAGGNTGSAGIYGGGGGGGAKTTSVVTYSYNGLAGGNGYAIIYFYS